MIEHKWIEEQTFWYSNDRKALLLGTAAFVNAGSLLLDSHVTKLALFNISPLHAAALSALAVAVSLVALHLLQGVFPDFNNKTAAFLIGPGTATLASLAAYGLGFVVSPINLIGACVLFATVNVLSLNILLPPDQNKAKVSYENVGVYIGPLKKGLRDGIGTFRLYGVPYNRDIKVFDSMSFEGMFKEDKIVKGKVLIDGKVAFDGNFANEEVTFDFKTYSIHIKNSLLGCDIESKDGTLKASFVGGRMHGEGCAVKFKDHAEYDSFEGSFDRDYMKKGKLIYKSGDIFEGELWDNRLFSGTGTYTWKDKSSLTAEWDRTTVKKITRYTDKNGTIYEPTSFGILDCLDVENKWNPRGLKVSFKEGFGKVSTGAIYEGSWTQENDATSLEKKWFFTGDVKLGLQTIPVIKQPWVTPVFA